MHERTITLDGIDLHLRETGQGGPVLFVHGLGGAGSSWQPTMKALAADHRTFAPDLPGFGQSDKPARAYTPSFFVDVLARLLAELGVERTRVVGASMGGHVALELALQRPDLVDRVVAVAPGGVPPASFEGTERLANYERIVEAETEDDVVEVLEASQPDDAHPRKHAREPSEILSYVQSPGAPEAFASALQGSANARRLGPLLGKIDPPALLVWGASDPMIPLEVCRPVVEQHHPGWLAVFPGCGHGPHAERPAVFDRLLGAFFAEGLTELEGEPGRPQLHHLGT